MPLVLVVGDEPTSGPRPWDVDQIALVPGIGPRTAAAIKDAVAHADAGLGKWDFAGTEEQVGHVDVVLACAGDVPTMEALAATELLRGFFPSLRIRFVNVVDLMRLQHHEEHPHGLRDADFDSLFTRDKPVIFAYHGYPWLIHRLTYRRTNHRNLHVRGYKEEGTTTTPFDMVVLNDLDRFHLVMDAIDRVPKLGSKAAYVKQMLKDKLIEHRHYVSTYGEDMAEIRQWVWQYYSGSPAEKGAIDTQRDNASSTPSLEGEEGAARK